MSTAHVMPAGLLPLVRGRRKPWIGEIELDTVETMSVMEAIDGEELVAEEQRLAEAAADGDGTAFATLYERYEQRAYNLALRITGSAEDAADAVQDAFLGVLRRLPSHDGGELAFGSYVFTATRNACYDLMQKRRRAEPSDSIPESATPVGGGAGGLGLDPGDPEEDPSRRQLLDAQRGEVREANDRLPERQREVLALRELEELSYDEIAAIMGMNRNSVAQLISRARLNLRSELRGTALESIAISSPDCERALPLIAGRDDGELEDGDADWLGSHLLDCDGCRLRLDAMQEAGASYRAWVPVATAPWLFEETMAKAAELVGADWSETIATRAAARAEPAELPGMPAAYLGAGRGEGSSRRRWAAIGGVLLVLLLAGLVTARGIDNREGGEPPVVESRPADAPAAAAPPPEKRGTKAKGETASPPETETTTPVVVPPTEEAPATESAGSGPSEKPQQPERARSGDRPKPSTPPREKGGSTTPPAGEPETTPPGREPETPAGEPEPPPREPEPPPKPPTGPGDLKAPPPSTPPPG